MALALHGSSIASNTHAPLSQRSRHRENLSDPKTIGVYTPAKITVKVGQSATLHQSGSNLTQRHHDGPA